MKSVRCPHCQSILEIGIGYYHDEALNLRCRKCKKVILATTEEDEKELTKLYAKPHHHTASHTHHGSHWNNAHSFHQTAKRADDLDAGGYDGCD